MADRKERKFFTKINAKVNALQAGKRNLKTKLNDKVKDYGDKKTKFLEFIGELVAVLGLVDNFTKEINNFLGKGKKYEPKIKKILIDCFNSNIACNLDDIFQSNDVYDPTDPFNPLNPYFKIRIDRLDFFGIFKVDPNTVGGNYLYGTLTENTLDRSIKNAIDTNTPQVWRNSLRIELDPTDPNILNFYIDKSYKFKPVNSLVIDLVNQINLIPKIGLLSGVINNMYGSMSFAYQPTKIDPLSIFNVQKLNQYIQKIIDNGEDLEIDNSFFEFTNEELFNIEQLSQNLSNNFLQIKSCNNAESVVSSEDLFPILDELLSATTFNQEISIIEAGVTKLEIIASKNVHRIDLPKFRFEFFTEMFKQLINSLTQLVYSPRFLTIMFIYFKLANPSSTSPILFTDFKDFLKKTKNILMCIVMSIFKFLLIVIIMPIIINQLISDANKEKAERLIESYSLYKEQYLAIKGKLELIKSLEIVSQMASSL